MQKTVYSLAYSFTHKHPMQKKTLPYILVGAALVAVCATAITVVRARTMTKEQKIGTNIATRVKSMLGKNEETKKQEGSEMVVGGTRREDVAKLPSCPTTPVFTTLPVAEEDFMAFRPLGFLSPPIHIFPAKHSSFSIVPPGEKNPHVPVVFPGDGWLTEIWTTRDLISGSRGYQIYFQPCKEIRAYLFHLGDISEKLKQALDASAQSCSTFTFGPDQKMEKCRAYTFLHFTAGDAAGKSDDFSGVDFGMTDSRVTAQFANNERYPADYPQYVSPVSYMSNPARSELTAKIGSWDGKTIRTAEPIAGSYMQDIVGTLQGGWFLPGVSARTRTDWSPFVALVHDYVDPTEPMISMGTSVPGMRPGLYSFVVRGEGHINRDFSEVKSDGNSYCYEQFRGGQTAGKLPLHQINGILIVALIDAHTLQMEYQPNAASCESTQPLAFTDAAVLFER